MAARVLHMPDPGSPARVGPKANFQSQLGGASMEPREEERPPFTERVCPRVGGISRCRAPLIQRAASFVAGPTQSTWNVADRVAAGQAALGFTPPALNKTVILSADDAVGAINAPTIRRRTPGMSASPLSGLTGGGRGTGTHDPIHDPLVEAYRRQRGLPAEGVDEFGNRQGPSAAEIKYGGLLPDVECEVESVPANTGSFVMFLPSAGPWSTATTQGNVRARMVALNLTPPRACAGAGATTFSAHGTPSDATAQANLRKHENHHARDHERIFNAVLLPWDRALTAAHTAGRVFREPGVSGCDAALYAAAGGTPVQVARRLWAGWKGANNAFHASPAGAMARPSNPQANASCSTSSIDITVP